MPNIIATPAASAAFHLAQRHANVATAGAAASLAEALVHEYALEADGYTEHEIALVAELADVESVIPTSVEQLRDKRECKARLEAALASAQRGHAIAADRWQAAKLLAELADAHLSALTA